MATLQLGIVAFDKRALVYEGKLFIMGDTSKGSARAPSVCGSSIRLRSNGR